MLRQGQRWCWSKEQESAFSRIKSVLSSDKVLDHFKPENEIVLVCDASPTGVGAILTQPDDHRQERPVACASRALNTAERNYSQIDREGLALIFAVKEFHKYIAGRHFTLVTDHKPLLGLFKEGKSIPEHVSARVQRWAITLSAYSYTLQHRPSWENSVDALSLLPLPYTPDEEDETYDINCVPEEEKFLFSLVDQVPLSAKDIAKETQEDITLKAVFQCVYSGWPAKSNDKLKAFSARKMN